MLAIGAGITIVGGIDGKLFPTTGIQISDMESWSENAEEEKSSNRRVK